MQEPARGLHPAQQAEAATSTRKPEGSLRSVFLVGFMGAGKSSVGQALARRLGWPFEDLDQRIVTGEKRSIEEIFRESGEAAFRQAEHKALAELVAELGSGPRVVALGGGTMVQPGNAALLEQAKAHLVFLDAPVEELFRRCQQEAVERPLGKDADQFSRLYQDRRPHYGKAAARIETSGKTIEAVAAEIAQGL